MKNANFLPRRFSRLLLSVVCLLLVAAPALAAPPAAAEDDEIAEYVKIYGDDCATQKIIFAPGDTVCAEAGAFLSLNERPRRFQWVAPDGRVVDLRDISSDPGFDKIVLPESGEFAQPGKWTIRTIGRTASVKVLGRFIVRRPFFPVLDLDLNITVPELVLPGERLDFDFHITNDGPDDGLDIEFIDEVPTNMVFVGMRQTSGPEFACETPKEGEWGRIICRSRGMALDESANFKVYYQVRFDAREGDTCTGRAQVTSATPDSNRENNYVQKEYVIDSPER